MTTQSQGLHTHVLETLGLEISSGQCPPGSVLRTDELARRFDVSRTVIREVVRVLESMHLVESRRRVGVTVRPAATWNVYDPQVIRWRLAGADRPRQLRSLTVLRSAIEPVAASLAARHATAEQCAELTERALGMVATSRGQQLEATSNTTSPSTASSSTPPATRCSPASGTSWRRSWRAAPTTR